MEILLSVLIPAAECVSPHVATRWRDHRDLKKNSIALKEASDKLKHRKLDLETRLKTEVVPEETEELHEVKSWLERAEIIICEAEQIGNDVARVKFLSRARLGRTIGEMIGRVERLYEEGVEIREGSLVRKIEQRGREKPTAAVSGGESTSDKIKREIFGCVADKKAKRIGIYGMGGIGKSTLLEQIHNELLKPGDEIGSNFDKVIWITASKDIGIRGLQEKIGREFELGSGVLRDEEDEETRARVLLRGVKSKRFLLFIDDLWEDYPLEKVGVPNPTPKNGCKLVITTRSRDVCGKMQCDQIIKMGFLSEEEASKLFFDKVGKTVASDPKLGEIARKLALECQGLPLAIVTVAGSMRDKSDPREWEVALAELKDGTSSMSDEITRILKFSYDRLKDEHKACLLQCALYGEDHLIPRDLLADQLIALGSVERGRARKENMFNKCHVMLNSLIRDCLVIDSVNKIHEKCVKLHDSVRDMTIQIMREETPSRFLVEDVASLKGEKWDETLEKVSLTGKSETIPLGEPQECPRLSTLFFNVTGLGNISENFFARMKGLCILDLSNTSIRSLPHSVVESGNISVLLLRNCTNLQSVPNISKLRNLTRLDLHRTDIQDFPQGLEKLVNLVYLDLGGINAQIYPKGLLSNLTNLRYLMIVFPASATSESVKELTTLNKLETLKVIFTKVNLFPSYFKSARPVCDFRFTLGNLPFVEEVPNCVSLSCGFLEDDHDGPRHLPIVIPDNVEQLRVGLCNTSLCRLMVINDMKNLRRLIIVVSTNKYMLYDTPKIFPLLSNIKELELEYLRELHALIGHDDGTASPLPLGAFSSLKKLTIIGCTALKTVFILDKEASFPHLEDVYIYGCEQLEEIIAYKYEDAMITELPALKSITLTRLPELKSAVFVANSLSHVAIHDCPELKNVTSSLQPFV